MMRLLLLSLLLSLTQASWGQRIGNSPYPFSSGADTLYLVNAGGWSVDRQITAVTLQGLLAKTKPQLMLQRGNPAFIEDLKNYGVVYDSSYLNDFNGLLTRFKSSVNGYVTFADADSSINAAIAVCSPLQAIALPAADTALANAAGLVQLYDATHQNQQWAFDSFQPLYNSHVLVYQKASLANFLSDYTVFSGAYHFWESLPLTPLANAAFAHVAVNGAVLGWGDEHLTTYQSSQHGLFLHAADFAANLSTYTNFDAPLQQHSHNTDTTIIPGKHTVCFVMTDGDNIQWLTNDFATNNRWYGSSNRGQVPIGWTVSPALAELAPTVMHYLYDTATAADYFVAGPSGMGYIYPEYFQPIDSAAAITSRMMKKGDLSIATIISDTYQPGYLQSFLQQPDIDGLFFFTYGQGYMGLHGYAECLNGKPVIAARYSLWDQLQSAEQIAQAVNAATKDPYSADGYSLIDVHVWSNSVDSVIHCAQLMDSNVRIVAPDAFVKLFAKGVGCTPTVLKDPDKLNRLQLVPNPASQVTDVVYTLYEAGIVNIGLHDLTGRLVKELLLERQGAGEHHLSVSLGALQAGSYLLILTQNGRRAIGHLQVVH